MYLVQIDHLVYQPRDGRDGFTLVEALREVYGVGNARILRLDGTVAVNRAGSSTAIEHAPSGRVIGRRLTYRAVLSLQAQMAGRRAA